jgi:hypothetical protein
MFISVLHEGDCDFEHKIDWCEWKNSGEWVREGGTGAEGYSMRVTTNTDSK